MHDESLQSLFFHVIRAENHTSPNFFANRGSLLAQTRTTLDSFSRRYPEHAGNNPSPDFGVGEATPIAMSNLLTRMLQSNLLMDLEEPPIDSMVPWQSDENLTHSVFRLSNLHILNLLTDPWANGVATPTHTTRAMMIFTAHPQNSFRIRWGTYFLPAKGYHSPKLCGSTRHFPTYPFETQMRDADPTVRHCCEVHTRL